MPNSNSLGDACLLRRSETDTDLWFAPAHDLVDAARRLYARHYLDRRWRGPEAVYRFSDEAMAAQELSKLTTAQSQN